MLLRLARFLAALIVAAVVWLYLTPAYNQVLATAANGLLKLDRRFAEAHVIASDRLIKVVRATRLSEFPAADIPADQLTFNIILLVALFASNRAPLRDRNVVAFLLSTIVVLALHPLAVVLSIEATYARRMGAWSEAHYNTFAAYAWSYGETFWRLIGMFGVVFICWWIGSAQRERPRR